MKKYVLTEKTISFGQTTLHRILCTRTIPGIVNKGRYGGYIEKEENLSHLGNCWVFKDAQVYGDAAISDDVSVYNNAKVYDSASIYDNAQVFDNALVYGNAQISNNAKIYDKAMVYGAAAVFGNAQIFGDARVFGNAQIFGRAKVCGLMRIGIPMLVATRSDGYIFLIAREEGGSLIVSAGCRYFTLKDARKHWRLSRGETQLGDESLAILAHLEKMAKIVNI